jgi:hypothetical protein
MSCSSVPSIFNSNAIGANQSMSKYTYTRKHKLNGKKLDITNEVVGMMNINEYLLATVPKLTKLIDEIHDAITSGNLTDQDMVYEIKRLFEEFEKQSA